MPNFWRTGTPRILKMQWFHLSILIFCQNSCFLGPTTELILDRTYIRCTKPEAKPRKIFEKLQRSEAFNLNCFIYPFSIIIAVHNIKILLLSKIVSWKIISPWSTAIKRKTRLSFQSPSSISKKPSGCVEY